MDRKFREYLSSFELFLQFQHGLRRRILEGYYKLFHNRIVRKINHYSNHKITNEKFFYTLSAITNLPASIIIDKTERDYIIRSAEKTVNGIYNLLGSGDVEINPIEWHSDFKTGFRWPPGKFFRNYDQENIESDSDVKIPRELSRSHHLLKLALAYRLTQDNKYSKICVDQIKNWINANPLMFSINWGCTMDVSIRAVNWIYALALISDSKELDSKTTEIIKGSLYQHGWYIWRNPEKALFNNSNHYLADLTGQILLGLLFSDIDEPSRWLSKGKEELFREIRMEILPSGMSYERSMSYNRLVLELIMVPILLLKRNYDEIPSDIWYRLEKMFEFLMLSIKPNGTIPIIGDQDNGRLLPFNSEETINFRYLISLGALLFLRPDLKHYGEGFNIFCSIFGGHGALTRWQSIPDIQPVLGSQAFQDVGLYIMKHKNNYLIFNATGRGLYPELRPGSHTHSDLLSFELYTQDKSFLIDPGCYVYTADPDQRMLFRSTKMHNTVVVDDQSQDMLHREMIWDYQRDAIPEVLRWESNDILDVVKAFHDGYSRLPEPVKHYRTITFDKTNLLWEIKDVIRGEGFHKVECFFHFDAGIDFEINGNVVETTCKDDKNIILVFELKQGLTLRKENSFVSKSYGIKENGNVLIAMIKSEVPVELNIKIMTLKKDEAII